MTTLASIEIYNLKKNRWKSAKPMAIPRYEHTATLLPDGTVLFVSAGSDGSFGDEGEFIESSPETYDPRVDAWTKTKPITQDRQKHTAMRLQNGKILIAGGERIDRSSSARLFLSSAELYNPSTRAWSPTRPMRSGRYYHQAVLLKDGRVFVVGGLNGSELNDSVEIYDPVTDAWSPAPALPTPRDSASVVLLSDGNVLVSGGEIGTGQRTSTMEIFDVKNQLWRTAKSMLHPRSRHTATLLPSGKILIVGGDFFDDQHPEVSTSELWTP